MPRDEAEVTPQLFADIFEHDRRGAAILEHLIRRFVRPAETRGGIDAVLTTYKRLGNREPLDYIVSMINRAAGVVDEPPAELAEPELEDPLEG
ncbi:MAG TPA: hypothetical protein VGE10_11105 [Zeimonas sp.]